jgi:hypothetical protein
MAIASGNTVSDWRKRRLIKPSQNIKDMCRLFYCNLPCPGKKELYNGRRQLYVL